MVPRKRRGAPKFDTQPGEKQAAGLDDAPAPGRDGVPLS